MNNFQRYLVDEFAEDYQERRLSRRDALKLIASVTGSFLTANSILAACTPVPEGTFVASASAPTNTNPVASQPPSVTDTVAAQPTASGGTVMPDDPAVTAAEVQVPADDATLMGYLASPAAAGSFPVVLVCHENRGLTPHIQDVTRRLAKAGYVGLAMDLLSRQGGSAAVGSENVPGALGNIQPEQFVQDFLSGWRYTRTLAFAQPERVGMVGFCFGGGVTWLMATKMPELLAAVPFYGPHPAVEDVPNINAAVQAIYGELDQRINAGIPTIEAAMRENNKIYEKIIYPKADHAFHNDTGTRYVPEAAKDAWMRTLGWFDKYLKS